MTATAAGSNREAQKALKVACPTCSAMIGVRCADLTSGSVRRRLRWSHAERRAAAARLPKRQRKARPAAPVTVTIGGTAAIVSQRSIRTGHGRAEPSS